MKEIPPETEPKSDTQLVQKRKGGLWQRIGGGALLFAIAFHIILLAVGAMWVYQIIHEPEKKVDFLPGDGKAGGSERSVKHNIQQKRMAQITPSTNVKRVFAEGAASSYSIPDPGDSFGEMSALSSLGGGGLSGGGLGGSGIGKGFGSGDGGGLGTAGLKTSMMFGIPMEQTRKVAVVMDVSKSMTKYLPFVAQELDKLSTRGPLILYFGCGIGEPKTELEDKVMLANGANFDKFWYLWQGKAPVTMRREERKKYKLEPDAKMPLPEIHKHISNRLDTYFIDYNGVAYSHLALLARELRDADTIYWFADFMDKVEEEEMNDVLRKLKSRKQKLFIHAPIKGRYFEEVRDKLVIPSGGTATVKSVN